MSDLEYIKIDGDRVRAELIMRACRDAGLHVELLSADDTGLFPAGAFIQRNRLLVYAADRSQVEKIIEQTS